MAPTRRTFLKATVAGSVFLDPTAQPTPRATELPRSVLGRTKERVTILGLGCAYAGGRVDEQTTRATLETALEGGVRYFDSAPEYTKAEERLGPVVKSVRDEVFLTTKTYAQEAVHAEKDLMQALANLQTDHVDLFLQHGVGLDSVSDPDTILGKGGSLEFMRKAKAKGLTRFIGMSVHAPHRTALRLLRASDEWDVVMPFVNYVSRAQGTVESDGADMFALAREKNLGIVAMKVLGGNPGLLADDYDRAFRYALSVEGVACAVIGVMNRHHVTRAVQAARDFCPMTGQEMADTIKLGEELVRAKSAKATTLDRHGAFGYRPIVTA